MVWEATRTITFSKHSNKKLLLYSSAVAVLFAFSSSLIWLVARLTTVGAGVVSTQHVVVIDTDTGIDDASAIMTTLGDSTVNVLGITCVRGNANVPNVVVNALKILTVAQKLQIPVFAGSDYGMVDSPDINNWFGKDGLGDLPFPNPPSPSIVQPEHAAMFLARIVNENPGKVTVLAIGPLTNLALALHLNPQFLQQVRRIVVLGGSIRGYGNTSPGVEFNFHMDPDAAKLVLDKAFETGTLITIVPLETCNDNDLSKEWRWKKLAQIDNSVMSFLNKLEKKSLEMHPSSTYSPFDTYAAVISLYPEIVTHSQELYGSVETGSQKLRGALIVDHMNLTGNPANIEVILEVNTTLIKQKMIENLLNFK